MTEIKKLLETRNTLKKKKPTFLRQEGHKKKKLGGPKWRKPKGMHSKLRRMLRGNRARVEPGWGSPRKVIALSFEGLKKIIIANPKQLLKLDAKTDGVIISGNVGIKKRVDILKKAKELKLTVLNVSVERYLSAFEEKQKIKSDQKQKNAKEKEEKLKEKEKKAADKEKEIKKAETKEESQENAEDLKSAQKKELDKVLTKKDAE